MTSIKSLQALDELVAKISTHTGLAPEEISVQMSSNIPSFKFDDVILVDPEDCGVIIDAWAANIKENLGLAIAPASKDNAKSEIADESIYAPESSLDTSSSLTWPDGFEDRVNHQYGPSLKKILPSDKKQRKAYLKAIAQETKAGTPLINELVAVIVRKYNGRGTLTPDKAKAGVLKKANEFLANA